MLTATCESTCINETRTNQIETLPSDLEIMRRVRKIKSSWTPGECVRRRREAERRFADLLQKLGAAA